MICPQCVGTCSVDEIELKYAIYDDKEIFFCPKCRCFSELILINESILEAEEMLDLKNIRDTIMNDALKKTMVNKKKEDEIEYVYAGKMFGEECYIEKGMKWNWTTKFPMFCMKILPNKLFGLRGQDE